MDKKISTQALVEGAALAAMAAVLMLAGAFIPLVGVVLCMLSGVPITVLCVRRGTHVGAIGAVAASLLVMMILSPITGLSFALQYMLVGLVFGWMIEHRRGAGQTLISGITVKVIAMGILMALGFVTAGLSMNDLQSSYAAITEETIAMYKESGMMEMLQAQGGTEDQLRQMMNGMIAFLPGMVAVMGTIGAACHYWLTTASLKRLKIKVPRMPAFTSWYLPSKSVWLLIAVWTLWLLNDRINLPWLTLLTQNILLVYGLLLLVTGVAVLMHYLDFKHLSPLWKMSAILFAVFFFSGVAMVGALAGLFDLVIDFRKIRPQKLDKEAS